MQGNRLKTLPQSITQLSELKTIDLLRNDLENLPDDLYKLKNLEELRLCSRKGLPLILPDKLGELSKLRLINFETTKSQEVFQSIYQLQNLEEVYLYMDLNLTDIQSFKNNLPKLQRFGVNDKLQ